MFDSPNNLRDLIYDWNELERRGPLLPKKPGFVDETIRDGIQSPSVRDPSIEQKMEMVRYMDRIGIHAVNLGLPGGGKRAQQDVERLLTMIVEEKLSIQPNCAARTIKQDILPIVEISQRVGRSIEVATFIGSSPIRAYTENWDVERMVQRSRDAVRLCRDNNLSVAFVTEDTTRSHPRTLDLLFKTAIDAGAERIVLCDTCGHATPDGLHNLLGFVKGLLRGMGVEDYVKIDWHGHNDRGHALTLALEALEYGVDRVHGCALGIGERVGNTSLDLVLLNLFLLGQISPEDHDLSCLVEYVEKVSKYTGVAIPPSYPLSGRDAFRTATGVHAAAILKAKAKGEIELADRVYSAVPATVFGRRQKIEIGYSSGKSNIEYWLEENGYPVEPDVVDHIFAFAKTQYHTLSNEEVHALIARCSADAMM